MTHGGSIQPRPSRNERREAAREKARELREQQRKRERRNRFLIQGGIIVAVVAVIALVTTMIFQMNKPAGPGPLNMASDGILIGAGLEVVDTPAIRASGTPTATSPDDSGTIANIVTYVDYLCPYCGDFENTNGETIRELVESGAATVEIHPVAILANRSAGTQYSLRASNAAACVANYAPDSFFDFNAALFANQPQEGTAGLSNEELKALVAEVGASRLSAIDSCIDEVKFKPWVQAATTRAQTEPIPNSELPKLKGTPTVLVNGKQYVGSISDPDEFRAFVLQAAGETYATATATPTPTPTP